MEAKRYRCNHCSTVMNLETVYDSGTEGVIFLDAAHDIAYNVYICPNCGMLLRESVWDFCGHLWIDPSGNITKK